MTLLHGDATMPRRWKFLITSVGLLALAAAAGCNRGGDGNQPAAATIGGAAAATPPAGGPSGTSPQKPAADPQHPVVLIETSLGDITVRLDLEKAPLSVDNFLAYAGTGFYDRTIVHQVYKGQGILGGGYGADLVEKSARTPIRNEALNGLKNRRGAIAMVRLPDAIDSATSQFFINVADNPALDYKDRTPAGYGYCVFGDVIAGMDVVDKINDVAVHDTAALDRTPVQPVVVKSIRRIR
jgi:cyclophilin family peptidyl-prolyl cis-trans isomerase